MADIAVQILMGLMLVCLGGMLECHMSSRANDKQRRREAERRTGSVMLTKKIHEHIGFIRGLMNRQ